MNNWGVSPLNAALQFRWKQAAQHSIVQHSRGLHLWKCYYFVTKASHFENHFNTPATESPIFMPTIILLERASHFQMVNILLWNEAFQGKNSLFAVIILEYQTVAAAIWLLPLDPQAGDEPPLSVWHLGAKIKAKKKRRAHEMSYLWAHFLYIERSLIVHVSV